MSEEGTLWGFADDCEAVSHPMTDEERRAWFDPRQRVSMLFVFLEEEVGDTLEKVLDVFEAQESLDNFQNDVII